MFEPVLLSQLPGAGAVDAFRCAEEREIYRADVERRAAERGLQPLRWPADWPGDTEAAMRVASWARQIGKVVAFSLAAFRQAFAGGRDLARHGDDPHRRGRVRDASQRRAQDARADVGRRRNCSPRPAAAAALGVRSVPSVRVGNSIFEGDAELEAAARELHA